MNNLKKPADGDSVTCKVCMKAMATADAITPEATDYYLHFCGLDCYAQWQSRIGRKQDQGNKLDR